MRIFVAVRPPEPVLDHLDLALAGVRTAPAGGDEHVRWIAREAWHLTVAFYGEAADGVVPELTEALRTALAGFGPYELALRGAGVFAHRSLWIGVSGEVDAERALAETAAEVGEEFGLYQDRRERRRAHLTVGRARPTATTARRRPRRSSTAPADGVTEQLSRALAVYSGPSWTVGSVTVEQSELGAGRGGGSHYTRLAEVPLGA